MLNLDIYHTNKCLSLELPLPIEVLAGELRAFHVEITMDHITQDNFTLTPANELGEHFMKLVRPDDTLQAIAIACREMDVLAGESREQLTDLLMADRFRDLDHMADYLQYGPDALHGLIRLTRDGRNVILPTSQINMYQCFGVETPMGLTRLAGMELAPVSELGKRLMAEFQPYSDTVAIANLACDLVKHPAFAQADLGKFVEGVRVFQMPMDTETLCFYCPLTVHGYDDNIQYVKRSNRYLARHEERIRDALHEELRKNGDMAAHLSPPLKDKVASAEWGIEKIGRTVYGRITCELRAPLTEDEQFDLAEWISGQNSDGLGEDFEQQPVFTDDGELYVSLWHDGSSYYVLPEDEFRAQVLGEQIEEPVEDQGFGGMGGMA